MAALCYLRRALAAALIAASTVPYARHVPAADAAPPSGDLKLAARQAAEQGKLLLVIDVPGDFLVDADAAPEAKAYRALAMSEPRVADFVASRFLVLFRNVGPASALEPVQGKNQGQRQTTRRDFAIAFLCTPSQRVLHFVPGLVSADALLRELTWAETCNRERLRASPDEQQWLIRERHLAAALPAHSRSFQQQFTSKWTDEAHAPTTQSRDDLLSSIREAQALRDQTLIDRLKPNWTSEAEQRALLLALAAHGDLEQTLAHLVLAEFPLPRLAEIQRPLYEIASRQRYWSKPASGDAIVSWWSEVRRQRQASLLVVRSDPFFGAEPTNQQPLFLPALAAALPIERRQLACKAITIDELAVLIAGAGLEPLRFPGDDGQPRYVVYDARGFRIAELSAREGTIQRLSQVLRARLKSGDLAAVTDAGGGTNDDNE